VSAITTHVLDTSAGAPAAGLTVELERQQDGDRWSVIGRAVTDDDGRVRTLLEGDESVGIGIYRLVFHTADYFARSRTASFYPQVVVVFNVTSRDAHYHVPLLLSPYGYSTYRGS
jgi:5-hydroxyisourate hydrolase